MKKQTTKYPLIKRPSVITMMIASMAVFFLDLIFFLFLPFSLAIISHLIAVSIFAIWGLFWGKDEDKRIVYLPILFVGVLGAFGALLVSFFGLIYLLRAKGAHSFAEWYEELFPKEYYQDRYPLFERIRAEREDYSKKGQLVPFLEVMEYGSEKQKGEAITKILEYFKPEFSPALQMGLKDENPVIRVRAATAVAKLEEDFLDATMRFDRLLHEEPKNKMALTEYAKVLMNYAKCAFVSTDSRTNSLEKAATNYQKYLKLAPEDEEVRLHYAHLLQEQEDYKEALGQYQKIIKESGVDSLPILKGYLETLFKLGKYDEIRKLAKKPYLFLDRLGIEEVEEKELLQLWSAT